MSTPVSAPAVTTINGASRECAPRRLDDRHALTSDGCSSVGGGQVATELVGTPRTWSAA